MMILSGTISTPRRPGGWRAPGSVPAAPPDQPELWPQVGEDLCLLSGDWRILQLRRGHRWSLDDLVTAWFAARQPAAPLRIADPGCGIGAVLLMLAWRFAGARCVGIEAEEASAAVARRSIAWNGAHDCCEVRRGDLRDEEILANEAPFDLVTATPPYLRPGTGRHATRPQQAYCNIEQRGGIDAYCRAAARVLAPDGRFVVCHATAAGVTQAASELELTIACAMEVIPRAGKAALFSVYGLQRASAQTDVLPPLIVRDRNGQWTDQFRAVRTDMEMPARGCPAVSRRAALPIFGRLPRPRSWGYAGAASTGDSQRVRNGSHSARRQSRVVLSLRFATRIGADRRVATADRARPQRPMDRSIPRRPHRHGNAGRGMTAVETGVSPAPTSRAASDYEIATAVGFKSAVLISRTSPSRLIVVSRRMSSDDAPTMMRDAPGSMTNRMAASKKASWLGSRVNSSRRVSPACRWTRANPASCFTGRVT